MIALHPTEPPPLTIARVEEPGPEPAREVKRLCPSGFGDGDYVTRDGSDVHRVQDMSECGDLATFVCVVAPSTGWTEVGEHETNLCRRYSRVAYKS